MTQKISLLFPAVAALIVVVAAGDARAASMDLSRLVVVGDSLSAGHQNSCLIATQQVNGFASRVADRVATDLSLPPIGMPGAPPCLTLVDPGPPPVVERISDGFGLRLHPTVRTFNLSVPGARIVDAVDPMPDNSFHGTFDFPLVELNALIVQGHPDLPKSQVDLAADLAPTALVVRLGSNDVLWSVIGGDPIFVTPEADFRAAYQDMMDRLSVSGAALVDMNAVLRFIDQFGLVIGGHRLTTDFFGGIFTLDGIHPTNTGHAVIANEFIRAMNRKFGAGIRPYSLREIAEIMDDDPLVLDSAGTPARGLTALEILRGQDVVGGF